MFVGIFVVKTESDKLWMQVRDPDGGEIDQIYGEKKMESKFDVFITGEYQVCFKNQDNKSLTLELDINTGENIRSKV